MPARRPAAACGALLVALAVPAAAEAATFTAPLAPCYVTAGTATNRQAEGFPVAAAGFTINSLVNAHDRRRAGDRPGRQAAD